MKIVVTGANGYLGQGIVKHLLDLGNEVTGVDFSVDNIDDRAKKFACNIFELKDPYEAFDKPDVVLHLAWRDGFIHNSEAHVLDFPKHYKFIKCLIDAGLYKITVMGTMHEVGFYEGSIDDNTPCNPTTLYGICKNALRKIVEELCRQREIRWQWLRGFYIVGNSKFGNSVFSKITSAALEGKKEFPFTMGQNQYDFLDYDEFCQQVAMAVSQDKINGIINICSGRPEKLADRVERFIKDNNYNITLNYGAFLERPYDSKAIWGNDNKILSILKGN